MNTLQLKREPAQGNAVPGTLILPLNPDTLQVATLENADFLIPAGKYPLKMTFSPRWNKLMPEICDVPGRSGIRFHRGSRPEHSKGCILVSPSDEQRLTALFLAEQSAHEETRLEIS